MRSERGKGKWATAAILTPGRVLGLLLGWGLLATSLSAAPWGFPIKLARPVPARPIAAPVIETQFMQVLPAPAVAQTLQRSSGQARAVVLLPGLVPHPFNNNNVNRAVFRPWQQARSPLVQTLGKDADVFAFAYSQNAPVEEIADNGALEVDIWRLTQLGYREIVLIGHSAGGLIARQFVEDHPRSGVTKVLQVCAPNGGSAFARFESGVRPGQRTFLSSLTKEGRARCLQKRASKQVPASVEFVCIVGDGAGQGDWIVSNSSQWPADLRAQGIPALAVRTTHFKVMHDQPDAEKIAELVRQPQPRWTAEQVAAVKKALLKD